MQSGLMKTKEWVLEYIVHNEQINPLMGWQSSSNTLSEVKMSFDTKEDAIDYAKKNKINFFEDFIHHKISISAEKISINVSHSEEKFPFFYKF